MAIALENFEPILRRYRPVLGEALTTILLNSFPSDTPTIANGLYEPVIVFAGGVTLVFEGLLIFMSWDQYGHELGLCPLSEEERWRPWALDRVRIFAGSSWGWFEGATFEQATFYADMTTRPEQVVCISHRFSRSGDSRTLWLATGTEDHVGGDGDEMWLTDGQPPQGVESLHIVGHLP